MAVVYGGRSLMLALVMVALLYAGKEMENRTVRELPGTTHFYQTEHVCGLVLGEDTRKFSNGTRRMDIQTILHGFDVDERQLADANLLPALMGVTYRSAEQLRSLGGIVQHCGECGQCSNPNDIAIYDETTGTLFRSSLRCSAYGLLFGRQSASTCMATAVDFTKGCHDCWVDNIMCSITKCVATCMWTSIFKSIKVSNATDASPQQLNECLQCDERRCGPAFLQCAGANRRRVGLSSDIQRSEHEECRTVDAGWWKSTALQKYFQQTNVP